MERCSVLYLVVDLYNKTDSGRLKDVRLCLVTGIFLPPPTLEKFSYGSRTLTRELFYQLVTDDTDADTDDARHLQIYRRPILRNGRLIKI